MTHPLDGCWAKIDRAKESLHNLNDDIFEWLGPDTNPYRIEKKIHLLSNKYSFTAVGPPVPLRYAVIAGEIIHHLRTSLDHLVWGLALKNVRNPDRIQFPVCDSPEKFSKACKEGSIKGVSKSARTIIEMVQPYHAENPTNSALYHVHAMDLTDKHQLVLVTTNIIRMGQVVKIDPGKPEIAVTNLHKPMQSLGATEDGTEVFALTFDQVHPDMDVDVEFTIDIAFERVGSIENPLVVKVLEAFCRRVSTIVREFENEF